MTLTEFLTARLDEDEDAARLSVCIDGEYVDDARAVREVEAKRAIVALAAQYVEPSDTFDAGFNGGANHVAWNTLRSIASVYADHPDYREEWKP